VVHVQRVQVREVEQLVGNAGQLIVGHVQPAERVRLIEQFVDHCPDAVQGAGQPVVVQQQRRGHVPAVQLGRHAQHSVRVDEVRREYAQ